MRRAVLSDIHGNWEALAAVLAQVQQEHADEVLCLGDVVGYGADPGPCLEAIVAASAVLILGNHESALASTRDEAEMNSAADQALRWTRARLSPPQRERIQAWPLNARHGQAFCVHGSPFQPEDFFYLRSRLDITQALAAFEEPLGFVGHTHVPMAVEAASTHDWQLLSQARIQLRPGHRYLMNVGSVGQPRDLDPRASWVLWDDEAEEVRFFRTEYAVATAQQKILAAGLPSFLAQRLGFGR